MSYNYPNTSAELCGFPDASAHHTALSNGTLAGGEPSHYDAQYSHLDLPLGFSSNTYAPRAQETETALDTFYRRPNGLATNSHLRHMVNSSPGYQDAGYQDARYQNVWAPTPNSYPPHTYSSTIQLPNTLPNPPIPRETASYWPNSLNGGQMSHLGDPATWGRAELPGDVTEASAREYDLSRYLHVIPDDPVHISPPQQAAIRIPTLPDLSANLGRFSPAVRSNPESCMAHQSPAPGGALRPAPTIIYPTIHPLSSADTIPTGMMPSVSTTVNQRVPAHPLLAQLEVGSSTSTHSPLTIKLFNAVRESQRAPASTSTHSPPLTTKLFNIAREYQRAQGSLPARVPSTPSPEGWRATNFNTPSSSTSATSQPHTPPHFTSSSFSVSLGPAVAAPSLSEPTCANPDYLAGSFKSPSKSKQKTRYTPYFQPQVEQPINTTLDNANPFGVYKLEGATKRAPRTPNTKSSKSKKSIESLEDLSDSPTVQAYLESRGFSMMDGDAALAQSIIQAHVGENPRSYKSLAFYETIELELWSFLLAFAYQGKDIRVRAVEDKAREIASRESTRMKLKKPFSLSHAWVKGFMVRHGITTGWIVVPPAQLAQMQRTGWEKTLPSEQLSASTSPVLPTWINFLRVNHPWILENRGRLSISNAAGSS